jgi:hypothetical protein
MIKTFQRQVDMKFASKTGWQSKAKGNLEIQNIRIMNCPSGALSVFVELLQPFGLYKHHRYNRYIHTTLTAI